jgi:Spx/MgsR family transcriptional regulator
VKIYGIKNCDSVKKAFRFFDDHGIEYEFVDFKKTDIEEKIINHWLKSVSLKELLNTRGTTYKTLKLKDMNLSDKEIVQWMTKEKLIIKRPVIEYDDKTLVAFDEKRYIDIFLSV